MRIDNGGVNLTRRSLLQHTGWFVAAAAIPPIAGLAAESASTVMTRLSTYMSEARDRALPDDVI